MSDEVKDAPRKVPQSMAVSVLINVFMSLTMITILFTLGDAETALTAPTNGYPIIYVIYAATISKVATGFMLSMTLWSEYSKCTYHALLLFEYVPVFLRVIFYFLPNTNTPLPHKFEMCS